MVLSLLFLTSYKWPANLKVKHQNVKFVNIDDYDGLENIPWRFISTHSVHPVHQSKFIFVASTRSYYSFLLRGKQRLHRRMYVHMKRVNFSPLPVRYLLTPLIFALTERHGISPQLLKACRFIELSSICMEKMEGSVWLSIGERWWQIWILRIYVIALWPVF